MRPFSIAGLQLEITNDGDNLALIEREAERVMGDFPWVQMLLLSELAVNGPRRSRAVAIDGEEEQRLAALARRHHVWLVPGSVYERAGAEVFNTTPVIDPQGTVVARYRKMFPFMPYEPGVSAGREPLVFDVPDVGRFGVSICYDLWFPETIRTLTALGAEVVLHPSLTTTIDRQVELSIVRASAACHQCFVLDVNGVGDGGNGQSIFCGPGGDVLHQAGTAPEVMPIEIDLDRASRGREVGLKGLGQPLKSFRDRMCDLPIYGANATTPYLESLGPLSLPERGTRAGIDDRPPLSELAPTIENDHVSPKAHRRK